MEGSVINLRDSFLTEDTRAALARSISLIGPDFEVEYSGCPIGADWKELSSNPGPTGMPPQISMRNTGREVYVNLKDTEGRRMVPELWSVLVPNGFVPWNRYPTPSDSDMVFHYFGDWYSIGDSLQGEGRGEHSWPSMCVASQLEVGVWEGTRPVERSVQCHLHRVGIPCGPVDGIIGDRVLRAIKSLGMSGLSLEGVLDRLKKWESPRDSKEVKDVGHLSIKDVNLRVFNSGSTSAKKTKSGILLSSWGPGTFNVIIDE